MALALDVVKGGFSAGQARAIGGQVQSAVSAAGTTISDATALTASINVVTTTGSGAGVKLPDCEIGDSIEVLNSGANSLTVYPPTTSDTINQLSAGGGFLLGTNTACKLRRFTASKFIAWLSA